MKGVFKTLLIVIGIVLMSSLVMAGTINVDLTDVSCVSSPQLNPYSVVYCNIQDAINDSSSGDIIQVAVGTYDERLVIDKKLTLNGSGSSTVVQPTNTPSLGVYDVEIDASGVIIQNFLFDFNDITNTRGGPDTGIVVCDMNEPPVLNVKILNNIIYTGDADTSLETGKNCNVDGLIIQGNTFYGDEDNLGEGIYVNPGPGDVMIDNNEFYGYLFSAISIESSNVQATNNIINSDVAQGFYGIRFIDTSGGETYDDVLISGNSIQNFQNGIMVGTSSDVGSTLTAQIEYNTLTNNDIGIWIRFGADLDDSVNYNRINDNSVFGINNVGDGIVNATLNSWGDCTGPYHSTNTNGKGDEVSDDVIFSPWLGICFENKSIIDCALETDDITISADLDGIEIEDVWFSYTINGTNYNTTSTNDGNTYSAEIPSAHLIGGINVTWNIYASDTINVYNNSWKSFYVFRPTYLGIDPWPPDGLNRWHVTEPEFSLVKDSFGGDSYYQWDSDDIFVYSGPFGLENIPNAPPKESAGTLELNWWTDFGICGNESKQSYIFYVDLTNPVINDLNPEDNSTVYNNLKPEISAYIDEVFQSNSGINKTKVVMKIDGTQVNATVTSKGKLDAVVSYTPPEDLTEGIHEIEIIVTDNSGRTSELSWSFTIVITPPPSMTVNSPQNGLYGERRIPFDIVMGGVVDVLEYINYNDRIPRWRKLCSNCDEYGNTKRRMKSFSEGQNNLTFRAIDLFGQVTVVNRSLFIDSKQPRISRTLPRRNSIVNGSDFYIKYTEDNLQDITLFWNGSKTLTCQSGTNQECITSVDLSGYDGKYIEYYFNVTDLLRTVSSRKTIVKVDTSEPIINNITLINISGRIWNLKINITEENLLRVLYMDHSDLKPRYKTLCTRLKDGICERRKSFRYGLHNITIEAIDKVGYTSTADILFQV